MVGKVSRESQLEDANLYNVAKAFAESVSKGDIKVKYEEESLLQTRFRFN